jgi:hypothetical protein
MYLYSTDKIYIVLDAVPSTDEVTCIVSYQDLSPTGVVRGRYNTQCITDGVTPVEMLGSPIANVIRQIESINVFNQDSAQVTVNIYKTVVSTIFTIYYGPLASKALLNYTFNAGWNLLGDSGGSSPSPVAPSPTITTFITPGTNTWTKPSGLQRVLVVCVGAGGGGGSGRQGAAGENRFGGGGGGGGAVVWKMIAADDLPNTITVTIGTGGAGGLGQTATSNNGNSGNAGGDTSFGGSILAKGGTGGGGGTTASASGGQGGSLASGTPIYGPFALAGGTGNSSTAGSNSSTPATGFQGTNGAPPGASGGGINNLNTSSTNAGSGGGVYDNGVSVLGPSAGASPNGSDDKSGMLFFSESLISPKSIGTGGAGGYPAFRDGGNGGRCAGGGGGSGTLNGTTSGKGGNGGNGLCAILEIY